MRPLGEERTINRNGLLVIYRKEMADHIHSRRFFIVLCLILITSFASIYGSVSTLIEDSLSGLQADYLFLQLFTLSSGTIPSFMSFIALLGPFVGITLGFDAINSEMTEGTMNHLVSQPVYRDSVINGKFLAAATMIFVMVFSMGLIIGAVGLLVIGIPPSAEEVGRIFVFLLFTGVYICFWLALSILFSVLCRHTATSAMLGIACWIFFALFMSMVVSVLVSVISPAESILTWGQLLDAYNLELGLNRLSPYYLYSEAVSTIMSPTVRTTNAILPQQLLAKQLIQRPEPTGAADHPVGHGVAPQFYPLALPIGLLAIQRHSILELFLHHIGYRRGCRHAFLHHRYRCLGLPDIAFSGLRFTMSTFVAGSIVIHHIHLGRYNHQFRANKLFPNPYHSAAALGTDPFLLRLTFRSVLSGRVRKKGTLAYRVSIWTGDKIVKVP